MFVTKKPSLKHESNAEMTSFGRNPPATTAPSPLMTSHGGGFSSDSDYGSPAIHRYSQQSSNRPMSPIYSDSSNRPVRDTY